MATHGDNYVPRHWAIETCQRLATWSTLPAKRWGGKEVSFQDLVGGFDLVGPVVTIKFSRGVGRVVCSSCDLCEMEKSDNLTRLLLLFSVWCPT